MNSTGSASARGRLFPEGQAPNVLVMSATPIPRTLGIILYGDLDISVIDELPARRLPSKTVWWMLDGGRRPGVSWRIRFVRGRQAYVICPMVEESEGLEAENVTDYAQRLRQEFPQQIQVGILHGQMRRRKKIR